MKTVIMMGRHCDVAQTWISEHIPDGDEMRAVMGAFLLCKLCGKNAEKTEYKILEESDAVPN